jgi:hypothetical protein
MKDIKTGVLNGNNLENYFFWEEETVDLDYEEYLRENPEGDPEGYCGDSTNFLYGDWIKVEDKYAPDRSGPRGYAAIYDSNDNTIQVVWSRWAVLCARCSPCFPDQGDLTSTPGWNSQGDPVVAYSLPPEYMSQDWQESHSVVYQEE